MIRKKKVVVPLIVIGLTLSVVGCSKSSDNSSEQIVDTTKQVQAPQQKENIEDTKKTVSDNQEPKKAETASTNESITYKTYQNGRYGFSINYPSTFETKMLPANGDGIILSTPNGQVELTVSGINNALTETAVVLYNEELKQHSNISYKKQSENWYVLSWVENEKIVYKKSIVGSGSINSFIIKYPIKEKEAYDQVISKLNASFKTPGINEAH